MCRFHVPGYDLVFLSGGFSNCDAVEGELVPVDLTSFVDCHCSFSFPSCCWVYPCEYHRSLFAFPFLASVLSHVHATLHSEFGTAAMQFLPTGEGTAALVSDSG